MKVRAEIPDFDGTLNPNMVVAKPIENMGKISKEEQLRIWSESIATRKRKGCKVLAVIDQDGKPGLYTDGINRIADASVAHLLAELVTLELPPKSVLVCEGTFEKDTDDQGHVWSILSSKKADKIQANLAKGCCVLFMYE